MKLSYLDLMTTDPSYNLAMEQYVFDCLPRDRMYFMLWQNDNAIIVGKYQNTISEINEEAVRERGIRVVRRLSGGGAVYHDMGNLNFTFSLRTQDYDLRKQQSVIVEACRSLGIPAEISGRNDILTNGCKFSGNSFYSHAGCSFHNGTLLVNVDMANLGKYLTPSKTKLESKGVASVRSRVINLTELKPDLTIDGMAQAMVKAFETVYGLEAQELREEDFDTAEIERRYQRFHSYDWVYGRSVPCSFSCAKRFAWGEVTIELAVENAVCTDAAVWSDAMDAEFAKPLADALRGCRFAIDALCERVQSVSECRNYANDLCALLREQDI